MRRFTGIILLSIVLASCGGPKIVPDEKLAEIFHDIYLVNAYSSQHPVTLDSLNIYEPVFQKYGYTSEDIQFTIGSFTKRKSARLSDDVVERASDMLRAESRRYDHRLAVVDTLARIARDMFGEEVYSAASIDVRRVADTGRLHIVLPARQGSYKVEYSYLRDTLDKNENVRGSIHFLNKFGRRSGVTTRRFESGRRERVNVTMVADTLQRSLVLDLNGYGKELSTPHITIDSLVVTYFLPDDVARDSLARLTLYETPLFTPSADSLGGVAPR